MKEETKPLVKRKAVTPKKAAFGTEHSPKTLREGVQKDITSQVERLFHEMISAGPDDDWNRKHWALIKLGEPAVAPLLDAAFSKAYKGRRKHNSSGFLEVSEIIDKCDEQALKRIASKIIDHYAKMPGRAQGFGSKWAWMSSVMEGLVCKLSDKSVLTPAAPMLIQRLGFNDHVQNSASFCLGVIGDRRAYEPLVKMASTVRFGTLYRAVFALGLLGDPRAVPLLKNIYFGHGKYKKYKFPGEYRVFKNGGDNQSMAEKVRQAIKNLSPDTELPKNRARWDVLGYASQDAYFNSRTYLGPPNYPGYPDIP